MLFAGVNHPASGLFATTDAGEHWMRIAAIDSDVLAIAVSPKAPDVLYVSAYKGIYISHDAGVSWTHTMAPFPSQITVAPSNASRLYGQYVGSLMRSDDGGGTWYSFVLPMMGNSVVALDPLDADSLWLAGSALMHSADGGPDVEGGSVERSERCLRVAVPSKLKAPACTLLSGLP